MSHLEGTNDFYEAGRKLAKHIAEHQGKKNFSTATLQALIMDMLPQHDEAQEALKSIVSRPDFLQLVKLSGSQKGFAQKTAFFESLSKIYNSEITAAADSLACGMLGLCAVPTTNDLEAQKNMTSTVSNKIEASEGNPPAIGDRKFEENPIRPIKELAAASISPAPPSHSAKKDFCSYLLLYLQLL